MEISNKAILFVSHLIPNECYSEVIANSKNNMQDAANALQWHLIEGFNVNLHGNYDVINFMPVGSYPQYYNKPHIKESTFDVGLDHAATNVGFINVKYIRRKSIENNLKIRIGKWCEKHKEESKLVILYTLNSVALQVLSNIKKKYSDLEVCAIVADLPNMINLSSKKNPILKFAQKKLSDDAYSNISIVDKFVFLTKQMSDYIKNKKPYCVMEGISNNFADDELFLNDFTKSEKTVLYTGTLHKKFGILQLMQAFQRIEDPDYKLIICGVGDSVGEILRIASYDSRVDFRGQCTRDEVLKLQRSVTVLVNPRMNNEEFTKYSFPSKNMEYLSSGTPLIAYKLDGIPNEYDEYINYVSGDAPEALAEKIKEICELDVNTRERIGKRAQNFVVEQKNAIAQTKKILDLALR